MTVRVLRGCAAVLCAAIVLIGQASAASADPIRDAQWHLRFLNVVDAHRITQGQGVTVAVVDTGVSPHVDLRHNLLPGIDFLAGSDEQVDSNGHGTGMAGLIAAHGHGSDDGILGVAPRARILPIRYTTGENPARSEGLARSVRWATDHGADVISLSLAGGPVADDRLAIETAIAANVVVVAAAGNRPADRVVPFPAAFPGVMAVAATDQGGAIAPVSVPGSQVIIAAPGVQIISTDGDGGYSRTTGTSDATAIVAGAVALVRSRYPDLSAEEVVHRLTATATDKGPKGRDNQYGYGVLNLMAALTADVPPLEATGSPTTAPAVSADTVVARRDDDNAGGLNRVAVVGAVAVGALILAGFLALVTLRRRSRERSR